jgi:hypothetical protein
MTVDGDRWNFPEASLPGNANLPIGGFRNANREVGVPGFQPTRFVRLTSLRSSGRLHPLVAPR